MTAEDWIELQRATTTLMQAHVFPFVTPISEALSDGTGKHVGTGGYIEVGGQKLLLTSEHVAAELKNHSIAHKFEGSDKYVRATQPFLALGPPEDIAVTPIEDSVWQLVTHNG